MRCNSSNRPTLQSLQGCKHLWHEKSMGVARGPRCRVTAFPKSQLWRPNLANGFCNRPRNMRAINQHLARNDDPATSGANHVCTKPHILQKMIIIVNKTMKTIRLTISPHLAQRTCVLRIRSKPTTLPGFRAGGHKDNAQLTFSPVFNNR